MKQRLESRERAGARANNCTEKIKIVTILFYNLSRTQKNFLFILPYFPRTFLVYSFIDRDVYLVDFFFFPSTRAHKINPHTQTPYHHPSTVDSSATPYYTQKFKKKKNLSPFRVSVTNDESRPRLFFPSRTTIEFNII